MADNWEKDFFRGLALEMWRRAISQTQTEAETAFLVEALGLKSQSRVLDVPCGSGRHSIELARMGHSVTGVDISEEFIEQARASDAPGATWIRADMREIGFDHEFDAAFCLGNSLYLRPAETAVFFENVSRALKAGGRFVLETGMAAESILPSLQRMRWFRLSDLYMLSRNTYDPRESRLDTEYTFIRGAEEEIRLSSSYCYTTRELCGLAQTAGMRVLNLYGSYAREPYEMGSPRLIVVAEALKHRFSASEA